MNNKKISSILPILLIALGLAYFLVVGLLKSNLAWIDYVLGSLLIANGLLAYASNRIAQKNKRIDTELQNEWQANIAAAQQDKNNEKLDK